MSFIESIFNLKGKIAVITGGGGVLATEIAKGIAKAGATVILLDINEDNVIHVAMDIRNNGGRAVGLSASVLERNTLEAAGEAILSKYGKVDILINAVGCNIFDATVQDNQTIFDIKIEAMDRVMDMNYKGTLLPSIVFGQIMSEKGEGNIINITAPAASQAITRVAGYSVAKAAVSNFTIWMATELAKKFGDKMRVNAISPGYVVGDHNRHFFYNEDGSLTNDACEILHKTPMNRFADPSELIGAIIFLASPSASFVTGEVLSVDGGFSTFSGV